MHARVRAHTGTGTGRVSKLLALLKSHFILDWVSGVLLLLALLVWATHVQILHVSGQHLGDSNARKNAHDGRQHEHQTDLGIQESGSALPGLYKSQGLTY